MPPLRVPSGNPRPPRKKRPRPVSVGPVGARPPGRPYQTVDEEGSRRVYSNSPEYNQNKPQYKAIKKMKQRESSIPTIPKFNRATKRMVTYSYNGTQHPVHQSQMQTAQGALHKAAAQRTQAEKVAVRATRKRRKGY